MSGTIEFKSKVVFEDKAICDYYNTIEGAIIEAYESVTGKGFTVENDCEAICETREALCERFCGCFPAWVSCENGDESVPCYTESCEYDCGKCPMQVGNYFPEFVPGSSETADIVAELIRCVKCDWDYRPDATEIEAVADILRDIDQYE